MCGILGLKAFHAVAADLLHGLSQMQHRGQDAAGLATYCTRKKRLSLTKHRGLVLGGTESWDLEETPGEWGIGHVRYATAGLNTEAEIQPITAPSDCGELCLAFNGNVVNHIPLRDALKESGWEFQSSSDAEVILASLVQDLKGELPIFEELMAAVKSVFATVEGGYSVVGLIEGQGMFAFRDPKGIRPLVMGDVPGGQAFASETYALSFIGCENIIDVRPGELVWLDLKGALSRASLIQRAHAHCCFEYVYFTKGNAMIEGRDVYQARAALGRTLARQVRERGISVDVVTSVPSTSHPAALAMAWELQVRIEEGFIRRDNSGRTFILPTQSQRERAVSQKLAPVKSVFQGRDVLIVDDSIVRGTVSQRIIRMARQCGARKVYFASTFPPVAHPCYYGIDMHSQEELLAPGKSLEEIERILDADAVIYNSESDLKQAIGLNDLCIACCSGVYPTDLKGVQALKECRKRDQAESFLVVG